MNGESSDKPIRQAAASIGGFLAGFVLGDGGLASNSLGTVAPAIGLGLLGFALVS